VRAAWGALEKAENRAVGDGRQRKRRTGGLVGAALAIVIVGAAVYLGRAWPFTQANLIRELERATSSTVQIAGFHRTLFPRPGCIAEGVTFVWGDDSKHQTVLTVEKFTVEGNLTRLLSRHVALIRATGAHAVFSPLGTGPGWRPTESEVVVDELITDGALLEFSRHNPERPRVQFVVHEFVGHHLAAHDPMRFELQVRNPEPPGEIKASGTFGPWKMDRVSETPVAGSYSFRDADLGVFGGIHGILSSDGRFQGTLESIEVEGATATPGFSVRGSSHKLGLRSNFRAQVDATNGDVTLDKVCAQLAGTTVVTRGRVAGRANQDGKTAALDLDQMTEHFLCAPLSRGRVMPHDGFG